MGNPRYSIKNGSYRNTWRTSIYRATAKDQNIQFEPLSMDKPWIEVELKAFLLDCIKQKSFASKGQVCIEDIKNIYNYQWEFTFQGKKDNLLNDFLGGFKSFLYLKTKEGVEIPIGNGLMNIVMPELTIKKMRTFISGKILLPQIIS